jgi:hypothetical protein
MNEETQPLDPIPADPDGASNPDSNLAVPEATAAAETRPGQTCPVCGVTILPQIGGDRVVFAVGPAGTRAKLWARVCQFAKKPECINQDKGAIGVVTEKDYFRAEFGGK